MMTRHRWPQVGRGVRPGLTRWLVLTCLLPGIVHAAQFTGLVVWISDSTTLRVVRDGRPVTVRLYGVEGLERGQALYQQALTFVRQVALRQRVAVVADAPPRAGRLYAVVQLPDGRDLGQVLVQAGYAWHDSQTVPEYAKLAQLEADARAAQRGVWAEAQPVPPWEWRKGRRVAPAP